MGFVCNGRYVITPVDAADAETYVNLQLDCLEETYPAIIDPAFGSRMRAGRAELDEEFAENIADPATRAFLAYDVPGWTPHAGLTCAIGAAIDWTHPVGFALSRPGPLPWESHMPVEPVTPGLRELAQLYTLARTHGTGLGQALFEAVIHPNEPAYLWFIKGNEQAVRFYEKNGFEVEGVFAPCGGSWAHPSGDEAAAPQTGRMFRRL
ncbi:GNAT family N-acetyltransferase [Rothia sp. LK2588]|uniref:GNAT family N-acetyltransferase n=1 Tax=Rothia sp. LK2588 TaxID=3114369 RepID=UPI0034CEB800